MSNNLILLFMTLCQFVVTVKFYIDKCYYGAFIYLFYALANLVFYVMIKNGGR